MSFIDDFLGVTKKLTDAPETYLRAAAYFCVSFLFGQNVYCADSRVSRCNEWFMLSGAPAITRKSTVIGGIAVRFCKAVLERAIRRRFGVSDDEARKIVDLMFFESGTTEGITDHLAITSDMPEIDRYALVSTEYGAVLKSATKKDYLVDLLSFISKLYYGEGGTVVLSARGKKSTNDRIRRLPSDLYVCAMVGLQDLHLYFDPIIIAQGFARRFVLVHANPGDKDRRHPPIDPSYKVVKLQFENLPSRYDDMFDNYNDTSSAVLVVFEDKARDAINKVWDMYENEYIEDHENSWLMYKQATWEHLYKLSVLEAISRIYDPPCDSGVKIVNVVLDDVKNAYSFISSALKSVRHVFSTIDAAPRYGNLVIRSGEIGYVRELIRASGTGGISKSELIKKSGLTVRQLDDLIMTLMAAEEVSCFIQNTTGRGRKKFLFFYKGCEPKSPNFEEISFEVYKTLAR